MATNIANSLDLISLRQLFSGTILAIHVRHFFSDQACDSILARIAVGIDERSSHSSIYLTNDTPFFSVRGNEPAQNEYLKNALSAVQNFRSVCAPNLSPADAMRLALDEQWPEGATLMRLHGLPMFFGITRMWKPGTGALPHQDVLERELATDTKGLTIHGQLGINLYLEASLSGGELKMWRLQFSDEDVKRLGKEDSYGFDESTLTAESITIAPEKGDLILLNTLFVHSVLPIREGRRTTVSGFVGYRGDHMPLVLWS